MTTDLGPKVRSLSTRQNEAVWYIAHGLTTREVGERMKCSEQTIKNMLYFARLKLRARNNAHLVYLLYAQPEVTSA